MQTEMFPRGLDINLVLDVMASVHMHGVHEGQTVLSHGCHVRDNLPQDLQRVGLYHDVGKVLADHEHPSVGFEMARTLDFEDWEADLIHYHHALVNLVNLGDQLSDRAIRRFLASNRVRLEPLIFLAHADTFDLPDCDGEWAKMEIVIERIIKIETQPKLLNKK